MGILDTVERVHLGLDYHIQRHNLLTANLSHIDTPGYRPLDMARGPSFEGALDAALATTAPGHLPGTRATERFQVLEDPTALAGMDGNAVSIDREAVKIASNQLRYDTLATLASQTLSGLSWAANDGHG